MSITPNDPVAVGIAAAVPVDKGGELNPYGDQDYGRVGVKDGCCVRIEPVKTDKGWEKSYRPLLNGVLYISEIETHDDGGDTTTDFMIIKGRTEKGYDLPPIRIPAKQYKALDWIFEHYSKWLNVVAGPANKDVLRFLIREISQGMKTTNIYTHTGFRVINGQLRFLTASGGLGADGLDTSINVRLPGNSAFYDLPDPISDPAPILADALHIMSVAPENKGMGAALLGFIFGSVISDIAPATFALGIFGESGAAKSAVGGLVQSFFGAGFYQTLQPSFPSNFHDTGAAIGIKLYRAKNVVQVIDEFTLNGSAQDANRTQDKLKDIVFNIGNNMGRDKCAPDMSAIPATPPRGSVLVLGESLPKGQSTLARMLVIEVKKGDIDFSYLNTLQDAARQGRFTMIMACYIQYIIGRYDDLKKTSTKRLMELRSEAITEGFARSHPRAADIFAALYYGAELFFDFYQHTKQISQMYTDMNLRDVRDGLISLFETQGEYQNEADEILYFRRLLKSAFAAGHCHINNRNTQGPPDEHPHRWGWRKTLIDKTVVQNEVKPDGKQDEGKSEGKTEETWAHVAKGAHIGFINEDLLDKEIWLLPEETYKLIKQQAKAQERLFHTPKTQLWRQLLDKKLSVPGEADKKAKNGVRPTCRKEINGVSHTVIVFPEIFITGSDEN